MRTASVKSVRTAPKKTKSSVTNKPMPRSPYNRDEIAES